jgi:hypothetical protein
MGKENIEETKKIEAEKAEAPQAPPVEMIEIPKRDYEILIRKAKMLDLFAARGQVDQQIAQLQGELGQL